jgi:glycosyltransferase involved in cell wall biosynthesis
MGRGPAHPCALLTHLPAFSSVSTGVIRLTHRCLAIIPAYNEAGCVASVIDAMREHAPEFDVVVIDDGSTDDTGACARRAGATVLRMPFNLGIGGGMQAGYLYALEHGYDIAVQVDADGQHDPAELEHLLAVMDSQPGVDLVYGSRFAQESGYEAPWNRRMGIRLFGWLLSLITRQRVTDPTSGFRMAGRRAIALFARDYPHDYPEVEAILLVHSHRLKIVEVPVRMRQRAAGRSSITWFRSAYYMIKVTLAVFIGLARRRPAVEPGDPAPVAAEHGI